jgi:hypothetical protein
MRPRELWFWLGGMFITAGSVLTALAVGYYTKEANYSLAAGPHMIASYIAFLLAFLCFLAAITGWRPWLRWQRFPNIIVRVDGVGHETATKQRPRFPPESTRLYILKVHITNTEPDRNVSLRAAYLLIRQKPDSWAHEELFSSPSEEVSHTHQSQVLEFPVRLEPQVSDGGYLVFEIEDYRAGDLDASLGARVEIHDAISGKMASFPANMGLYKRGHGLRPTSYAERVNGIDPGPQWYGLMGPPDRENDSLR